MNMFLTIIAVTCFHINRSSNFHRIWSPNQTFLVGPPHNLLIVIMQSTCNVKHRNHWRPCEFLCSLRLFPCGLNLAMFPNRWVCIFSSKPLASEDWEIFFTGDVRKGVCCIRFKQKSGEQSTQHYIYICLLFSKGKNDFPLNDSVVSVVRKWCHCLLNKRTLIGQRNVVWRMKTMSLAH